jgi:hypothetical protein
MTENPCLKPACLSDVPFWIYFVRHHVLSGEERRDALACLYDAEWKKRGYRVSP